MIFAPQILPFDIRPCLSTPQKQFHIFNPVEQQCHPDAMRLDWTGFNIPSIGGLIHLDQSFSFPPLIISMLLRFIFFKVLNMSLKHRPVSLKMNIPKPRQHSESHPLPEDLGAVYMTWRAAGLLTQMSCSSPAATKCKSLTRACF